MAMWRKTIDTTDVVSYEYVDKVLRCILEARYNQEEQCWDIFHTFFSKGHQNYTSSFTATTRDDALKLLHSLRERRLLNSDEIDNLRLEENKCLLIDIKRIFNDYNVEKWSFSIGKDPFENILYLRDHDVVVLDIIMHESYKTKEERIIKELLKILGLRQTDADIQRTILYYSRRKEDVVKGIPSLVFGNLELGLDNEQ